MTDCLLYILHTLIGWDTNLTLWINGTHSDYWDNFMEMYSMRFVWLSFYLSFGYVMFKHYCWKVALICIAAAIILLVLNDQLCSSVIRRSIGRLRPSNLDNPMSAFVHVVDGYRGGRMGFPSAHASNSWGTAFFVIYMFRHRLLSVTMVLWSIMMCYSRLYLGVHYLGDTVAGLLLGLVNATLVCYLLKRCVPQVVAAFRPEKEGHAAFSLPAIIFWISVTGMLVSAFFVDPS